MSKAILYAANTSNQALTANSVINFGSVIRRYGKNINLVNGNAVVQGDGYYDINCNIGFTAGATLTSIALFKDGVAIPGAEVTLTTVADSQYAVSIPGVIRETGCPCMTSTITAVVSAAATVTNAAIDVEKE